jgi:hypothetical protein
MAESPGEATFVAHGLRLSAESPRETYDAQLPPIIVGRLAAGFNHAR